MSTSRYRYNFVFKLRIKHILTSASHRSHWLPVALQPRMRSCEISPSTFHISWCCRYSYRLHIVEISWLLLPCFVLKKLCSIRNIYLLVFMNFAPPFLWFLWELDVVVLWLFWKGLCTHWALLVSNLWTWTFL